MQFTPFPKIPRWKRDVIITEKIDGTNASVMWEAEDEFSGDEIGRFDAAGVPSCEIRGWRWFMFVGSRKRWITPGKATDNFGFAAWAYEHADELALLGPGQHFGEWYGSGIQRGYGLSEKRFALFDTSRWGVHNPNTPACCEVVPVLDCHPNAGVSRPDLTLETMRNFGSALVPGFDHPEGIVIYHTASRSMFKMTLDNNDQHKEAA